MKKFLKYLAVLLPILFLVLSPNVAYADFELKSQPEPKFDYGIDELNNEWTLKLKEAVFPVQWILRPNGGVLAIKNIDALQGNRKQILVVPGISGTIANSIIKNIPSGILPGVKTTIAKEDAPTYVYRLGWNPRTPIYVGEDTHPTLNILAVMDESNDNGGQWWNPMTWWGWGCNLVKGVGVAFTGEAKNHISQEDIKSLEINGHSYYEDAINPIPGGVETYKNIGILKWKYDDKDYDSSMVSNTDTLRKMVDDGNYSTLYSLITSAPWKYPARVQYPSSRRNVSNNTKTWIVDDPRTNAGIAGFIIDPFTHQFSTMPVTWIFQILHLTAQIDSLTNMKTAMNVLHAKDLEGVVTGESAMLIAIITLAVIITASLLIAKLFLGASGVKQTLMRGAGCALAGMILVGIIVAPSKFMEVNQAIFGFSDKIANQALKDTGITDGVVADNATESDVQEAKYWMVGIDAWSVYSLSHGLLDDALSTSSNPAFANNMIGIPNFNGSAPKNYALIYADSVINRNVFDGNGYRAIDAVMSPVWSADGKDIVHADTNPHWNHLFPGSQIPGGNLFAAICLLCMTIFKLILFIDGVVLIITFIFRLIVGVLSSFASIKDGVKAILYSAIRLGIIGTVINITIYLVLCAKGNQATIFITSLLITAITFVGWKKGISSYPQLFLPPIIGVVQKSVVGRGVATITNAAKTGWKEAKEEQKSRKTYQKNNRKLDNLQAMRTQKKGRRNSGNGSSGDNGSTTNKNNNKKTNGNEKKGGSNNG